MRLRYLTCNHSLCSIYRLLSKEVFYYLGHDRSIGWQSKEETITDLLMRELMFWKQNNSYSKFDIRVFSRQQERLNGADFEWDWYFVDGSGKKWLGFRIQAKILNLKTNKFKYLYKQNGHQLNTLMSSSKNDNRIPYYCFYLHKDNENPFRGCSLASPNNVRTLLNNSKMPDVSDVINHSFPWHLLFCCCNFNCDFRYSSQYSLPEGILENLKELDRQDNLYQLLSEQEVLKINYLLTNELQYYDPEKYYSEVSPDFITIIQDKAKFYD